MVTLSSFSEIAFVDPMYDITYYTRQSKIHSHNHRNVVAQVQYSAYLHSQSPGTLMLHHILYL